MSASPTPRFFLVLRHELRLLLREHVLWLAGGLFLLLVAYAMFNGCLLYTSPSPRD